MRSFFCLLGDFIYAKSPKLVVRKIAQNESIVSSYNNFWVIVYFEFLGVYILVDCSRRLYYYFLVKFLFSTFNKRKNRKLSNIFYDKEIFVPLFILKWFITNFDSLYTSSCYHNRIFGSYISYKIHKCITEK